MRRPASRSVKRLTDAPPYHSRRPSVGIATAARAVLALGAAIALAGCSISYIARAGYEEARILWNRKPISTELASPDLPPELRAKFETVLKVRQFASEQLGLDVGGAYESFSQVEESAVVHVVMAAPRDSLTPYRWWFPIVGYVPYRGYFNEANAQAEADEMEASGYDTMVRPAVAFSSLGFFDDPLLSDLLDLDRVELAGVIIHELFHRTYFLPGEIMFDESAADFVGTQGAADFFSRTEGESSPDAVAARAVLASNLRFSHFLLQEQARLLRLYMSGLPKDKILKRRQAVFAGIKADYAKLAPQLNGLSRFDIDKEPLNNAVMVNYLIYFHDLDNFAALERMNHGDTRATIKRIIEIAESNPYDPFYALWQATREAPPALANQSNASATAPASSSSNPPKK
jgi:predicted aminopeptidase